MTKPDDKRVPAYKSVSPALSPYDIDKSIWDASEKLHRVAELIAELRGEDGYFAPIDSDECNELDRLLTELEVEVKA